MNELLTIEHLKVELMGIYGLIHAVRDINLTISKDEIHGIVGESGCGKSMTAKSILRLHNEKMVEYSGKILLDGERDVLSMSRRELLKMRGKDISMIFQDPMTTFNPLLRVGDQIAEMLLLHENITKAEAKERAIGLLEKVGILPSADRYKMYPFAMSGGQLQRASIAMSLACNPRLLIADEPTTALDVSMQAQILKLMKNLQQEMHSSVLLITHNFGVVTEICDRVSVMYAGQIVESGTVRDIFYRPYHPYTHDLIKSIPKAGERKSRLVSIPGTPPKLSEEIIGCAYAPRCPHACARCFTEAPEMRTKDNGHRYLCHLQPGVLNEEGGEA